MEAVVVVGLAGLLGLALGSFATVAIHRWPRGAAVTEPKRSACPTCGAMVAPRDNVPVLSFLLLRGRCRACGAGISPRYAVVELTTALLFAAVTWVWGWHPLLPALLVFVWALVVATAIDLEHRIIPNRLTYRLPFVLLPLVVLAAALDGDWAALRGGVIWALVVPAVMFTFAELFRLVRGQAGMGMGDVKLAVSIGLVVGNLGGVHLVAFAYATIGAAVVVVVGLLVSGRARLASRVPFGPYLAAGSLVVVLAPDASATAVRTVLGV
ncbi:prepilin peptidase [Egicoccus halophilus]|uniref:Prepilin leader peptidase/N-methyltransferase n=1 Tax=Egicoccus halophilus TaxID=1670830 RepID=A0A8J3AG16_9ACTN|nr:A24 family peptidase [Egicoccus halophilus]GGI07359.1 type 4 prepilin-like proteins leader peptide-processing enzyme [Egicoccus halophilus]